MNKRTKAYLAKKQLGGEINQRGNDYELTFTCYRIMQFIRDYLTNLHGVIFSSQHPGFVDDLYINVSVPGRGKDIFHQLKTSAKLCWGNGLKSLHDDFNQQKAIQHKTKKPYHMYLVVSEDSVYKVMRKNMPTKLRKCSSVELFPWYGSTNAHCI